SYASAHPPDLHPFPTRRSSDLSHAILIRIRAHPLASGSRTRCGKIHAGAVMGVGEHAGRTTGLVNSAASISGASAGRATCRIVRSEEHTSELQSRENLVCRLLL